MSTATLAPAPVAVRAGPARTLSLDVLRGLAVVGMLLVNNEGVEAAAPAQLRHSVGGGLTVADVVFPLFLFVAGLGAGRTEVPAPLRPVLRRCALLFGIGCLLVSAKYHHLSVSTGVLQHIALASLAAYAVLRLPRPAQPWAAGAGLLAAWALPTFVALPGTVAGSWDARTTLASAVERLVTGHGDGKEQVVASVVSALTVLAGVQAARTLRGPQPLRRLLVGAAVGAGAGLLLARGVPIEKQLWTPSYVLVTAGLCAALLAGAVAVLDRPERPRLPAVLAQPLRVLGANAICVYVATSLLYGAVLAPVRDRLVAPVRAVVGDGTASVAYALSSVVVGWLLCAWLWRRRVVVSL